MIPRINWLEVPEAIREATEPLLMHWLPFLPSWCELVVVQWEVQPTKDYSLSCTPFPEYRKVNIHIYPGHLSETLDAKTNSWLHEIIHVHLETMRDLFRSQLLATTEEGDPLRKWAEEELRKALEGAVCDLTSAVLRLPLTSNVVIG